MDKLGILLKSYRNDLKYVESLIISYHMYNADNIPLYLIVPESDINIFKKYKDKNISLLSEKLFEDILTIESVNGFSPGYINQQIIKLAFWEKNYCENYFCLDSDGLFIRNFYLTDFMFDENTPYTILVEDNELKVEPEYYKAYWKPREEKIRIIQNELGLVDNRMLTCHGMTILSSKILKSFKEQFLIPNHYTYINLLEIAPYEFSWYNMWLQKTEGISIKFREPIFKVFHNENQLREYFHKNITIDDIARGYIGIIINSNWQDNKSNNNPIDYKKYASERKRSEEYLIEKYKFDILINAIFGKLKLKLKKIIKYLLKIKVIK